MTKSLVLVLALAACGKSKAAQCTEVIETYNAVGEAIRKGVGDGSDPAVIEATTKGVEDATKAFIAVDVKDSGVKSARDDLAKAFTDHIAIMKKMAGAVRDAKDPAKADAAMKTINAAAASSEKTTASIQTSKQALMTVCNATAK